MTERLSPHMRTTTRPVTPPFLSLKGRTMKYIERSIDISSSCKSAEEDLWMKSPRVQHETPSMTAMRFLPGRWSIQRSMPSVEFYLLSGGKSETVRENIRCRKVMWETGRHSKMRSKERSMKKRDCRLV